jgi:hypothetical protein
MKEQVKHDQSRTTDGKIDIENLVSSLERARTLPKSNNNKENNGNQLTHLQDVESTIAPPIKGPRVIPTVYTARITAR